MKKRTLILTGFILVKFLLQFILISNVYDLQRDEYLHLDQAHHLAWGYLSVPPLTSWVSWLILHLGNSVFWVKFFPALFGTLTLVVVWKTIETLGGNLYALILGATCILFSALLRLNTLFQPNSFDVLSWTTLYFILISYFSSGKNKWLYISALVFALGFLNKYNIGFLLSGFIPAILLTKQRNIFLNRHLYMSACLALMLISPNLIWQYNNGFPVVHHLKELADTQLVHVNRADFLKAQLLFFIGALVVIIAGIVGTAVYRPFRNYRAFAWAIFFTLIVFIYYKAKDYYAIGLYPVYIAFGSVVLENALASGWKKYLRPVMIAIPVLLFIPLYRIGFPNKTPEYIIQHPEPYKRLGLLRWEDGKDHELPQDFADMLGWKELATKTDSVWRTLPGDQRNILICDNYGQAGAINFYAGSDKMTATSFNADYINWLNPDKQIKNVVLVKEEDDDDPGRIKERPYFDTVYLAAKRLNPLAREKEISIYVLKGARIDVKERLLKEKESKKKEYNY